jgi:hypothetical protein
VPLFSNLVWQHAQVSLVGTILTPGQRTVAAALRIMGLNAERQFQTYHRVLNRAAWSSWAVSRELYEPAPPRRPHQPGRPRLKGQRLPTLAQLAANVKTRWQRVTLRQWYGEGRRTIEIVSGTAVWRQSGQPVVPIRWVLIRDPKGKFQTHALLCTDLNVKPVQIVKWFVLRWQLEVTFHEVREHKVQVAQA